MRSKLILITLFFSALLSSICEAKILVAINLDECTSCYQALDYLQKIDKNGKFFFVFQEKYKADSANINSKYYLDKYKAHYIWSDSLYKDISINGLTSLKFFPDGGDHTFSLPLKLVSEKKADVLRFLNNDKDSLLISDKVEFNGSSSFNSSGGDILIGDKFRNRVVSYNVLTGKADAPLTITDSMVRVSYDMLLGQGAYQRNIENLKRLQVPKILELSSFWKEKDVSYILMDYKYFTLDQSSKDTVVSSLLVLNAYKEGKLISINGIQSLFNEGIDSFFIYSQMHFHKGILYVSSDKSNENENKSKFIAKFKLVGNKYDFDSMLPTTLPPVYRNHNYSEALFYNQFYALELEDKIYNVNNNETIDIGRFPKDNVANLFSPPKMIAMEFKANKQFVWLLYYKPTDKRYCYYKYDYLTHKMIFDKELSFVEDKPITIDDIDFDYVLYKSDNNNIVRTSISKL